MKNTAQPLLGSFSVFSKQSKLGSYKNKVDTAGSNYRDRGVKHGGSRKNCSLLCSFALKNILLCRNGRRESSKAEVSFRSFFLRFVSFYSAYLFFSFLLNVQEWSVKGFLLPGMERSFRHRQNLMMDLVF